MVGSLLLNPVNFVTQNFWVSLTVNYSKISYSACLVIRQDIQSSIIYDDLGYSVVLYKDYKRFEISDVTQVRYPIPESHRARGVFRYLRSQKNVYPAKYKLWRYTKAKVYSTLKSVRRQLESNRKHICDLKAMGI